MSRAEMHQAKAVSFSRPFSSAHYQIEGMAEGFNTRKQIPAKLRGSFTYHLERSLVTQKEVFEMGKIAVQEPTRQGWAMQTKTHRQKMCKQISKKAKRKRAHSLCLPLKVVVFPQRGKNTHAKGLKGRQKP